MTDTNPFANLAPIGALPAKAPPMAAPVDADDPFKGMAPVTGSSDAPAASAGSISGNFTAKINSGVADVIGAPMDFGVKANKAAMDAGQWLKQEITGAPADYSKQPYVPDWIPTSSNIESWMGKAGVKTSKDVQPQNLPERMAAGAGESVAAMGETYAGGKALLQSGLEQTSPLLGRVVRQITEAVGPAETWAAKAGTKAGKEALQSALNFARTTLTQAGTWGTAGATGKLAEEVAPDQYKPLANFFGQLLGGGIAAGGTAAVDAAARGTTQVAGKLLEPLTSAGQERIAATKLRGAATDQGMTAANLEDVKPLVPGSEPTTGQGTNDPGLMQLERSLAQKNPAEYGQRLSNQNAARVDAVRGMSPDNAQPSAASDFFKQAYDAIDQQTARTENAARSQLGVVQARQQASVDQAARQLEDTQAAHQANVEAAQGQIAAVPAQQQPNITAATNRASAALGAVPGAGAPQQYGVAIRNGLIEQERQAKAAASQLWEAVDPTGTATVAVQPFKQASFNVRSQMPKVAKPMEGEERAIFDAADSLPDVAPFRDLQALDSRIGSAIRAERGSPAGDLQAVRRLQILKNSIRDTMAGVAEQTGSADARAMQTGTKEWSDTIFSRLQQLSQDQDAGVLQGQTTAGDVRAGTAGGNPAPGPAAGSSGSEAPADGTALPSGAVPGGAAGNPRLSPPTADEELAQRYSAAKAATLDQKQRFNQGPVSQALQAGPRGAPFAVMDSAVGDKLFVPGPKGGETIAAYQRAGGDMGRLRDYVAYSLRQATVRNGEVDPAAFARWTARYSAALNAIPHELTAPFYRASEAQVGVDTARAAEQTATQQARQNLTDATATQRTATRQASDSLRDAQATQKAAVQSAQAFLEDQAAQRVQALKTQRTGAAQAFLKDVNGAVVATDEPGRAIGETLAKPDKFREFARQVSTDPDAKAGAQQLVVDYLLKKFQGSQVGVGSSENILKGGQMDQWLRQNRTMLQGLFSPEQLGVLDNVVADIQRQNLVTSSSKLPMGSNTTQDIASMGRLSRDSTVLDHIIAEAGGATIGAVTAGVPGAVAGGIAAKVLPSLRAAGLKRVDDLLMQAVMDPQFGALLLKKAGPKGPDAMTVRNLAARLSALTASAYATKDNGK